MRLVRYCVILALPLLLATMEPALSGQPWAPAHSACAVETAHGGGLNACGCHFNRKTGQCHCHRPRACGCACQPASCP